MGKTRLAVACLAEAERAGLPTARAAGSRSAAQLPFGALSALLPAGHEAAAEPDAEHDSNALSPLDLPATRNTSHT